MPQSNRYRVPVALGRTKTRRQSPQRERPEPPATQVPEAPDTELESYLAALSPEEDVETTGTGRRFGTSDVYQLRLPLMANERLKELASRQGISPGALARDWIMQHLENEVPSHAPAWPQQDVADERTVQQQPPAWQQGGQLPHGMDQTSYIPHGVEETDAEITVPHGDRYPMYR